MSYMTDGLKAPGGLCQHVPSDSNSEFLGSALDGLGFGTESLHFDSASNLVT